jgi:hypothetical protein
MTKGMLWSDAWVLLATIYAARDKPAPLEDVIAAADFIQHAIVTFEEMEGALDRLISSGYLLYSEGNLSPSEKTLEFYRSITKPQRKVHDEEKDLERFIGSQAWEPEYHPQSANVGVSFPALTRPAFDAAVKSYLGRHPKLTGVKKRK